jgi:phage terminase large subunit
VRGPRRDILYINECNSLSWETYYQLSSRTNKVVFLDFNPVQSFWVHENLIPSLNENEYRFIKSTYLDNEYLPEKIKNDIERRALVDENYKRVYADGEIGNLEGVIFSNWSTVNYFPESNKKIIAVDFGFTNDPIVFVDSKGPGVISAEAQVGKRATA